MTGRIVKFLCGIVIATAACPADAHTSSLGYVPGTTPGSVTFWTGSYEHGTSVFNEGTFTLTGLDVPYSAVVNANVAPVSVKPTGLVDGVNNFFWAEDPTTGGYDFPVSTDPIIFGLGISYWQGISFTGLAPGNYSFTCGETCGTTQQWESLSDEAVNITLTSGDIGQPSPGGVPEPSTWAMLMGGIGLLGGVLRARRKAAPSFA